jgi:hypothetical protein
MRGFFLIKSFELQKKNFSPFVLKVIADKEGFAVLLFVRYMTLFLYLVYGNILFFVFPRLRLVKCFAYNLLLSVFYNYSICGYHGLHLTYKIRAL